MTTDAAVPPTLFDANGAVAPEQLPTNVTTRRHPVHRWCNFIAGFSPEFVHGCISQAGPPAGATLLDPFAGMATALIAANSAGLEAVGYEPHPFFFDVGGAKLSTRHEHQPVAAYQVLRSVRRPDERAQDGWSDACVTFLRKLVPDDTLALLGTARHRVDDCPPEARPIYRLMLSRMLEMAAGSVTDGIYKAPTTRKRSIDYHTSLGLVYRQVMEDVLSHPLARWGGSRLFPDSSERMSQLADDSVDICITSPPYLNNFDFAEMTRMELYFWGYAGSWSEITERVRSRLIVNTTTAPAPMRNDQQRWAAELPQDFLVEVEPVRAALADQARVRAGKKTYHLLIYPYFAQMLRVLRELVRVLRPGAPLHLVVADAALYGVHVHTEQLLARLMDRAGFTVTGVTRLRDRGGRWVLDKRQGSAQPLGEFHLHAATPGEPAG